MWLSDFVKDLDSTICDVKLTRPQIRGFERARPRLPRGERIPGVHA